MNNNAVREMLYLINGFSNEGILFVCSQRAAEKFNTIAAQHSAMVAITLIIEAYKSLRDTRRYDRWEVGEYLGYTIVSRLYRNRVFEIWIVHER
jgi:hypothetical protein